MKLRDLEEYIGILVNVEPTENNHIKITFQHHTDIEIPSTTIPITKLQSLVGTKVGILRLQDQILLRKIDHS